MLSGRPYDANIPTDDPSHQVWIPRGHPGKSERFFVLATSIATGTWPTSLLNDPLAKGQTLA